MTEGQSVSPYLTVMKEYRNQLVKMGKPVASSTHAAMILRNVPESWRSIPQTIRMIATDPDPASNSRDLYFRSIASLACPTYLLISVFLCIAIFPFSVVSTKVNGAHVCM
jgi:gag-polypeptide of LTR copia-type